MAKSKKEIERWVTIKGRRVPIFTDGTTGLPGVTAKEAKQKQKAGTPKTTSDKKDALGGTKADKEYKNILQKHVEAGTHIPSAEEVAAKVRAKLEKRKKLEVLAEKRGIKNIKKKSDEELTKEIQSGIGNDVGSYDASKDKASSKSMSDYISNDNPAPGKRVRKKTNKEAKNDTFLSREETEARDKKSTLKDFVPEAKEGRTIKPKKATDKTVKKMKKDAVKEFGTSVNTEGSIHGTTVDDLKNNLKKRGLELESADAADMKSSRFNDEKVTLYGTDGKEYIGTYNRYMDGDREVVSIRPKDKYDNFYRDNAVNNPKNQKKQTTPTKTYSDEEKQSLFKQWNKHLEETYPGTFKPGEANRGISYKAYTDKDYNNWERELNSKQATGVTWDANKGKKYKTKNAIKAKQSAEEMAGVGKNGFTLHETNNSAIDTSYELRDKDGNVAGTIKEAHNGSGAILNLYKKTPKKSTKSIHETSVEALKTNARHGIIGDANGLFLPQLKILAEEYGISVKGKSKAELAAAINKILAKRKKY